MRVFPAWKGTLKVGQEPDATIVPTFNTAVLSSAPEQNGVALAGEEGTELVLVIIFAHYLSSVLV